MQMTTEQTTFYLRRLMLFMTKADLARKLECSRPSIDRWIAGEGLPNVEFLPLFEKAWDDQIDDIEKQGFLDLAQLLDSEERPVATDRQKTKRGPKFNVKWLKDQLANGKKVPFQRLMGRAISVGITYSQLQYASRLIGVKKVTKKVGGSRYNLWYLP